MNVNEEEASVRSRESVDSVPTMGDAESTGSEAQRRRTACAWARSERAMDGARERIHAGVVTQSMEGDRMDSLWRAMNVIEGGQSTSAEAKEVREKVVTAVEERWQAGEIQEPLLLSKAGWQAYVRKLLQETWNRSLLFMEDRDQRPMPMYIPILPSKPFRIWAPRTAQVSP